MKKILAILILLFILKSMAFASPPYLLEDLLGRAKFVFIAKVVSFEDKKVELKVTEKLRGEPEKEEFVFKFIDGEKPIKDELYFVFSQGHDKLGKPEDVIWTGQPLFGQISYCGWVMLPIVKEDDVDIVKKAGSGKFYKQGEPAKPLTLEQTKSLVKEGEFKGDAEKEKSSGK